MRHILVSVALGVTVMTASGSYLREGQSLGELSEQRAADEGEAMAPQVLLETGSSASAAAKTGAQWRFSTNYVPQHYGNWKFEKGNWNFGGDDRIECEACGYCLYYAVDQLGDNFDAAKVEKVLTSMSTQVQWVFKSGCEHIVKNSKAQIIANMMKLIEPQETCRATGYCGASPGDVLANTGATPIVQGGGVAINPVELPSATGVGRTDMLTVQHPGRGFLANDGTYQMYPSPGARPIGTNNALSPYNFGGYDAYGFPEAAPGVPSSTPPPPSSTIPGLGLMSNPSLLAALSGGQGGKAAGADAAAAK